MFDELKTKLAIKWLSNNKKTPKLMLNANDKLYLAVSKKNIGKLVYIYTLVNQKASGNRWDLFPTTEVATFDKKHKADIYYQTVNAIMNFQHELFGVQFMAKAFQDEILKFKEHTK